MSNLNELECKIRELRALLHSLLRSSDRLTDPETVTASQLLDSLLNEYYKILKKKL